MAGCGSKKMAKGGMVKMSPRKAMAMGKKPSGGKTKVKKFAMGGLATSAPMTQTQLQNMNNAAAAKAQAAGRMPSGRQSAGFAPAPTAGTGFKGMGSAPMTQTQLQNMNNAAAAAKAQAAGRMPSGRQSSGRKFAKGGMVKKGCK